MKRTLFLLFTSLVLAFSVSAQGIVGKWKLSSMQVGKGNNISITAPITLNISQDHKIGGKGGCNSYGGSYSLGKSNKVKFSEIFSTKMFCEGTSATESTFFQSLGESKTAQVKNGKLILQNKEKRISLVFEKAK